MSQPSMLVEDTKVAGALNLHETKAIHPTYHYRPLAPFGSSTRNIFLDSQGSDGGITFEIPTEVVNMGESYLEYNYFVVDQGAGNYPWMWNDKHAEFQEVIYRDTGTEYIVELKKNQYYQALMPRLNTSLEDLAYNDSMNGLVASNAPLTDVKCKRFDNSTHSIPFREPVSMICGTVGTGDASTPSIAKYKKIYLKDLAPDSFYGIAKNAIFPVLTYAEFKMTGSGLGYLGTSPTDPTAGNAALTSMTWVAGGAGQKKLPLGTGAVILQNITLQLAVEQNQNLVSEAKKRVATGYTMPIPWTQVNAIVGQVAPSTFNLTLDNKKVGKKLKKIIFSKFAQGLLPQNLRRYYDHQNTLLAGPAAANPSTLAQNTKVSTYGTSLDSAKLQRTDIVINHPADMPNVINYINRNDDYMLHKSILKNTCYLNQKTYNQEWVHIDSFEYPQFNGNSEGLIYMDGYDLVKPVIWSFDCKEANDSAGTASTDQPLDVAITIGQKLLSINANSFVVA